MIFLGKKRDKKKLDSEKLIFLSNYQSGWFGRRGGRGLLRATTRRKRKRPKKEGARAPIPSNNLDPIARRVRKGTRVRMKKNYKTAS